MLQTYSQPATSLPSKTLPDKSAAGGSQHVAAAEEADTEAFTEAVNAPLQKGISGMWRDCNSPISSADSGHMSTPDADIDPEDFQHLDMTHSMHSSASLQRSSSSSADTDAAMGWGSLHGSQSHAADVLTLESKEHSQESGLGIASGLSRPADNADSHLMLSSSSVPQSAELADQGPSAALGSAAALPQGGAQSALLQQGMAAATAQLLLMGSQWGSNLGSLCNLGLILSPEAFILLTPKYEIIKIIGEGAYGKL